MIFLIILEVLFFVLTAWSIYKGIKTDDDVYCLGIGFGFIGFLIVVSTFLGCVMDAHRHKVLYNDMAENPQCYSVNDLKEARKDMLSHKAYQGTPFSFYNGYELPDFNTYTIDDAGKLQLVQ